MRYIPPADPMSKCEWLVISSTHTSTSDELTLNSKYFLDHGSIDYKVLEKKDEEFLLYIT